MTLRFLLLALLAQEPNTGYGINRLLRKQMPHLWLTSIQHIYAELANMHADGLVEVESIDLPTRPVNKKVYSLSLAGEETLDKLLLQPIALPQFKDELAVRLYCAERLPPLTLERQIEDHILELEEEERALAQQELAAAPAPGTSLSFEFARERLRERIASCGQILQRLEKTQPPLDTAAG